MVEIGYLYAIIGVFSGIIATFLLLQYRNPRLRQVKETETFWFNECQNLRKEIRRLKSSLTNAKQGRIPYDVVDAASTDQFVDGIMSVLPPNLKGVVFPFKGMIRDELEKHPEYKDSIIEFVKQKAGAATKQDEKQAQHAEVL